jgi:hypothetical protein
MDHNGPVQMILKSACRSSGDIDPWVCMEFCDILDLVYGETLKECEETSLIEDSMCNHGGHGASTSLSRCY